MAITTEEKQDIVQDVLTQIKAESQSVDSLETVDTLDGIETLPAMRGTTVVSAPVSLLGKPAVDAAAAANAAVTRADNAASAANEAAMNANTAKDNANTAITNANSAAAAANDAASAANAAATEAMRSGYKEVTLAELNAMVNTDPSSLHNDGSNPQMLRVVDEGKIIAVAEWFSLWNSEVSEERHGMMVVRGYGIISDGNGFALDTAAGYREWQVSDVGDGWEAPEELLGGSGGGNIINVTEEYALESGYHTLATAIAAVEEKRRAKGRCVTYEKAQGQWETKQFKGTSVSAWDTEASWEDFGGAGTVKSLTVNGTKKTPDTAGNVSLTIEQVEVDESLDAASTNPVQNKAVTARLSEVEAGTVFGMSAEVSDDESSVRLALTNKSGAEIASVDIPAGSGGSGEATTTKIVLTAATDVSTVKEGGAVRLTWSYDHQYSGGDDAGTSTGQKATVAISVKRGTTVTYSATLRDVSKGTYTLDLTKYLLVGTTDIYVTAEATDPTTGRPQRKQSYVSVKVVTLSLASGYNLATGIAAGGYAALETASIPYAVSGTGTKSVTLYVDGVQTAAHTVTRSGTTNGSFDIAMNSLTVGRHTVQMVAEMETDGLTLRSESIYMDLLKAGDSAPFVGIKTSRADGAILGSGAHRNPVVSVGQYEKLSFEWVCYDPDGTPATVEIWKDGVKSTSVSAPRSVQTYTDRFTTQGTHTIGLKIGATAYTVTANVTDSGIEISEAAYGLALKLDASGRSNGESEPGKWSSNDVETMFEGMDWSSNGWTGEALKLTNGAKATIGYKPFATDIKSSGVTIEMTLRVSNVTDGDAAVVSCIDGGKGLLVTASEAGFKTGESVSYENEDGETVSREIKLGTNYVADQWIKIALTVGTKNENRLLELYVNGNRTGADIYDTSFSFQQDTPQPITLLSDGADVEVKGVRIYTRRLSDDEELENRMVDMDSGDEMMALYEENDIMGESGQVDIDKIRGKGKGALRIVRSGKLDDVFAENNKKTDFSADIFYYSPFGSEHDFVLRNCNIRIQGTSSTKYPSKNIRIYLAKGGSDLSLTVGGVVQTEKKYPVRPGAIAMSLICLKSDYSDSSMSLNTGGAKLWNEITKEMGLLTPPQRWQYEQGGDDLNAVTVRQSIDGVPIDVFVAETEDGENDYVGQYNFNNEKSKSGDLFGMSGVSGYTAECPISLEMLNNTEGVCLFKTASEAEMEGIFDAGAEVNYGIDSAGEAQSDGDVKYAGLQTEQQTALKRLYNWIRACVPAGADSGDLTTFASNKFKNEVSLHFDVEHLLTYYLFTDYMLSVDQRAKNMMLRTWNGLIWYITYYDGDTQLGKRNDCFLVYLYTTDRDTWDPEMSKYAFEGHDSWLWNLVLANLQTELRAQAQKLRQVMTVERVLAMLNNEQAGNWSDRAYNKSGELKYIKPAVQEMYGKVWPFIYALQGSNRAHREYFVRNRFALLDAKYGTSNFTSDNIDLYLARAATDSADVLKVTASEVYAFGYGTNNSPNIANSGIVAKDGQATLTIAEAYTINDPIRVYGASRMKALDMSGACDHIKNALDLGKCTVLQSLNLQASGSGSTSWWLSIGNCRQLRTLNLRNQAGARTGSNSSTELDLTAQTKLESLDARGCTAVQSVVLAKGAPVTTLRLPSSLTTLRLEYLSKLTSGGLNVESYTKIKTFIFDSCPQLDWETIYGKCGNVERLRVTGIDRKDDGTWLAGFTGKGGVDADGNYTDACALVGTVHLTKYLEDEEYATLRAHFPELNIVQPEYTMIEFDESVTDDANVSNLDNRTGYKYGNAYVPSGHIAKILSQRHRVLAKVTKKATTRSVTIAGVETTMNNLDGEVTVCQLDDSDSYKYAADGSASKLDGTEGDWMMYEPFYWGKGVNDFLNGKKYSCRSSNGKENMPKVPVADVLTLDDIKAAEGGYENGKKIMTGKETLASSYTADSAYSVCKVAVAGRRRVRFPSVPGTNLVGSVFTDSGGNVVSSVVVSTLGGKFEAGMYIIADVPDGATALYFSILNTAEFDKVVLSDSGKIEDMEPEWVAHDECLVAVVGSSVSGEKLRACITGGSTTASMTWTDFHYYSAQRGMQQIDAEMHSRIANMFYAKYGRRDAQEQCGAGSHTNARVTGGTASRGMQDTIGYDAASAINSGVTNSMVDNLVHQYAWYEGKDINGNATVTQVNNICCLGYEDIYGHKYDMMDGVDMPNSSGNTYKWRIWEPDGSTRWVQGKSGSGNYIAAVAHGLHEDVVAVGTATASSSTCYCDIYYVSGSVGRVVYRGYYSASAHGGVSNAYASLDASYSYADVGSRLAFRGKIVKASSVSAFKALTEVA